VGAVMRRTARAGLCALMLLVAGCGADGAAAQTTAAGTTTAAASPTLATTTGAATTTTVATTTTTVATTTTAPTTTVPPPPFMYLRDLWVEPTPGLDGLQVHAWVADEAGQGTAGAEVQLVLALAGEPPGVALTARTDPDGFAVAVAWGDVFEHWNGGAQAEVTDITHPDYRLHRLSLHDDFPGNFWFPTGCCETAPGAANYGVRNTTWCPAPRLARVATRQGDDGSVEWRDAASLGRVVPQMGYLDYDGVRWLVLPGDLLVDAGAMQPCP
jgi:hypothetical protein